MIIRSYLDADFDSIILLWERCHFGENGQDLEIDIERKIAHDPELFLVAELSGQVVGTLMGGYDGHCGSGYYLAVHPDFRGRGIANALITRLEKKLMARGCAKIYLRVNSQNYMLINMFEKLSYEEAKIFMMEKPLTLPLDFDN